MCNIHRPTRTDQHTQLDPFTTGVPPAALNFMPRACTCNAPRSSVRGGSYVGVGECHAQGWPRHRRIVPINAHVIVRQVCRTFPKEVSAPAFDSAHIRRGMHECIHRVIRTCGTDNILLLISSAYVRILFTNGQSVYLYSPPSVHSKHRAACDHRQQQTIVARDTQQCQSLLRGQTSVRICFVSLSTWSPCTADT